MVLSCPACKLPEIPGPDVWFRFCSRIVAVGFAYDQQNIAGQEAAGAVGYHVAALAFHHHYQRPCRELHPAKCGALG